MPAIMQWLRLFRRRLFDIYGNYGLGHEISSTD